MAVCSLIAAGVTPDCDNPLIPGVNDRLILFNHDDVVDVTFDVTDNEIITDLVFDTGGQGFVWQGQNFSNEPASRAVVGRYAKSFEHEITFLVFGEGNAVKEQLNLMSQGKITAMVQNQFEGTAGDSAFTYYGLRQGMQISEMEQLKADQETLGAYRVVLKSFDQALEGKLPNVFFTTDFSTTLAKVDGYLIPAV